MLICIAVLCGCNCRYLCNVIYQSMKKEGLECVQQGVVKARTDSMDSTRRVAAATASADEPKSSSNVAARIDTATVVVQGLIKFNSKCERFLTVSCHKSAMFTKVCGVVQLMLYVPKLPLINLVLHVG